MKNSFFALVGRGFPTDIASSLIEKKYTLSKIKKMRREDILSLGISDDIVNRLFDERRPAIAESVIVKLLHDSRNVCCICRNPKNPIVIHHIIEWNIGKDNSERNLAVLCPNHHAEAHTKRGISKTLNPQLIRKLKSEWIKKVNCLDTLALLKRAEAEWGRWDYINNQRMFEFALRYNIDMKSNRFFEYLRSKGILDNNGIITSPASWSSGKPHHHLYNFCDALQLSYYTKDILEEVLLNIPITNISKMWRKSELQSIAKPGMFICAYGGMFFKKIRKKNYGLNQLRLAYKQAHGIKLSFHFDAWYCTSTSAWADHLSGHTTAIPICLIKDIRRSGKRLEIECSCLAIGAYFDDENVVNYDKLISALAFD